MGDLKNKTLGNEAENTNESTSEDRQTHKLTKREADFLRALNVSLKFHTLGADILKEFIVYIAVFRLGYPEQSIFQFEFDWNDPQADELTITLLPAVPTAGA